MAGTSAQPVSPARRFPRRVPDAQLLDFLRYVRLPARIAAGIGAPVGPDGRGILRRAGDERHSGGPRPRLDRGPDGARRAAGDRVRTPRRPRPKSMNPALRQAWA